MKIICGVKFDPKSDKYNQKDRKESCL